MRRANQKLLVLEQPGVGLLQLLNTHGILICRDGSEASRHFAGVTLQTCADVVRHTFELDFTADNFGTHLQRALGFVARVQHPSRRSTRGTFRQNRSRKLTAPPAIAPSWEGGLTPAAVPVSTVRACVARPSDSPRHRRSCAPRGDRESPRQWGSLRRRWPRHAPPSAGRSVWRVERN